MWPSIVAAAMFSSLWLITAHRYNRVVHALSDRTIFRHRWLVAVLAMLTMTTGARFIGVTNDYRGLFTEDNPQLAAFDALEDTYSASNSALIAVAPGAGTVFTREALGAIEELTEAAWRVPYSTRVDSLTNYSHSAALGDNLVVEPLVDNAQSLRAAEARADRGDRVERRRTCRPPGLP